MNEARWERAVVFVDMDAFFASVEIRDNPQYHGLPIAVGGSEPSRVVQTSAVKNEIPYMLRQ